jgi:methylthioribose-1-phosphate isomerase
MKSLDPAKGPKQYASAQAAAVRALDGEYDESDLPLLLTRRGMAQWLDGNVRILDRRQLPLTRVFVDCREVEDVARAIESMAIQGAFTLSLAAGYGVALAAHRARASLREVRAAIDAAVARLAATRPTGLALQRRLAECKSAAYAAIDTEADVVEAIVGRVDAAAERLARQALATARYALPLLADVDAVLTHCFADRSLLYLLLEARAVNRTLRVFCSETRPFLQGARLTAPSVAEIGHRATLITDGMGGFLMRRGEVGALLTAADRVCLDGTICNKIGTYPHAVAAKASGVPYYVLRQSGPDRESKNEDDVHIEFRDGSAVLEPWAEAFGGAVDALYPAFDITPGNFVTAIVTDQGAFDPREIANYVTRSSGG